MQQGGRRCHWLQLQKEPIHFCHVLTDLASNGSLVDMLSFWYFGWYRRREDGVQLSRGEWCHRRKELIQLFHVVPELTSNVSEVDRLSFWDFGWCGWGRCGRREDGVQLSWQEGRHRCYHRWWKELSQCCHVFMKLMLNSSKINGLVLWWCGGGVVGCNIIAGRDAAEGGGTR